MADCGNMPDWHPYNPQQAGRTSAPTGTQNASAGHMFVPGLSPPSLEGMSLSSSESRHQSSKHQNDAASFVARNYPPVGQMVGSNCPTSSSLTPGVHMTSLSSCGSHYGATTTTRNPMMDNLGGSMDPRIGPVSGINEEVAHRNSQMQFPGAPSHPGGSGINVNAVNAIHGPTMATQSSPVGSMSPGRQGVGYGPCKAPCCNPEAGMAYQHWDKFAHYHGAPSASAYRDNIRPSGYPVDNRRFLPEMNLRKDCMDGKELEGPAPFALEHRRNYPDYKYRKDGVIPRNYPNNGANLLPNYPMQNYGFANEYQKCPYTAKDYMRRATSATTMSTKSSGMLKYQDQQNAIAQQKYQHAKQMNYPNGSVMTNAMPGNPTNGGVNSPLQNSYYNSAQMPRDYSRDYQQEPSVAGGRIPQPANSHVHGYPKYHQVYHQKIAMQRYSVENHLRAFSRLPGYQSHPKYQECFMRYRELLKLQQTVDYQSALQEAPKIASPAGSAPVAPINLQFDQNGMLVNSSYMSAGYTAVHGQINPSSSSITESGEHSTSGRIPGASSHETVNQFVDHTESSMNLTRELENQMRHNSTTTAATAATTTTTTMTTMRENGAERYFMHGEKHPDAGAGYENDEVRRNETLGSIGAEETTKGGREQRTSTSAVENVVQPVNEVATSGSVEYKNSKDFADKPELDVRQFLANWDESEDEDSATTNMPDVGLSDSAAEQFEATVFAAKTGESNARPVSIGDKSVTEENPKEENPTRPNVEGQNEVESTTNATVTIGREAATKEIRCIRTDDGSDDIPTIHIVDSLEGGTEVDKIHTVFGSLASAVLNPISMTETIAGNETIAGGETIVLFEENNDGICAKAVEFSVSTEPKSSEVVEEVMASIIDSSAVEATNDVVEAAKTTSDYETPKSPGTNGNDEFLEQTRAVASSGSSGSSYTNSNSVTSSGESSKSTNEETTNLPKQSSFTSDESHNPDDISLPDLQTSECTPISTTLNTPIHSDSEESTEHVSDLTISTNPIEIIQNSPIISFTHSPIKIEPYEQLDDGRMDRQPRRKEHAALDFDFDREVARRENEKYNETTNEASEASVVDALEAGTTGAGESMLLADIREPVERYEEKSRGENTKSEEFYRTADPLVGMANISKSDDRNEDAETATTSVDAPITGNIDSHQESPDDPMTTTNQLEDDDKCPTILEPVDDFDRSEDLEKLCDMSLDGSCMIPLIPGEEDCSDEPRMPVPPMEGNCLTRILNDTLPITDLDVLESSEVDKLEKTEDDMWVEVRYMDRHLDGNSSERTTGDSRKARKSGKIGKSRLEKSSSMRSKNNIASEKIEDASREEEVPSSNFNAELAIEERIQSPRTKREASGGDCCPRYKVTAMESSGSDNCPRDKIYAAETSTQAMNERIDETAEESRRSRDFCKRRISRDERQTEETRRDLVAERPTESDTKSTITTSISTKRRDSNVEIQVSNLNLKIHDKETTRNETSIGKTKNQESSGESVDAIEIKINLSRDVISRRTGKFLEDDNRRVSQDIPENRESSPQHRETAICASGKKCCRRRRRSMPDGFETTKRTRKNDDDRSQQFQHYTAKKIKSRSRRKARKSMDDELLMSHERQRKETLAEDRNFHLEMAKTFNLPWPRDKTPEIGDSCSSNVANDEETSRKDRKSFTTKSRNDSRPEKHAKETRTVSPAYNSSVDNSSTLDFDNFDVAPHNSSDTDPELSVRDDSNDARYSKSRARLDDRERYRNPTPNYAASHDELASFDAFEINLNTVPIYTTKDGRITYSPNRNYTYRALIMEARQREGYPPIRKLHYPRHSSKFHYRDGNPRRIYKKHHDDERPEKKRRGLDYHSIKAKRGAATRINHPEETEARGSRSKKHDVRRRDSRISGELEYRSDDDDDIRGFCVDRAASKSGSSDAPCASFGAENLINLPELELPGRRTEISRIDDPVEAAKHSNVMKNATDPLASPKHFGNREVEVDSIVSKIFQGQEFEISARKVADDIAERLTTGRDNCHRDSRFFRDTRISMKTPMASPLVMSMDKKPVGWDIEQDFQNVLSDSGLESSTTYIEASKESRRIQRWSNSFVDKVPSRPTIFSNIRGNDYEAADLSHEKSQEKASRFFDPEPISLRIRKEEKVELRVETTTNKTAVTVNDVENPFAAEVEKISSVVVDEKAEKIETEKPKTVLTTPKICAATENPLESREMSEIVKSLDLAVANCNSGISKESRAKIKREKLTITEENRRAPIFSRSSDAAGLTNRVNEVLPRRASSDDVDASRETRNLFFRNIRLPEIAETRDPEIEDHEHPELTEERETRVVVEETENQETRMTTNEELADRSTTPMTLEATCKDFLIDTSTSFSSCMKLRVPDPVSDMPTESEGSRLEEEDDTSTRFASVSMDFKDIPEASNSHGNFTFSNREIHNSSALDDATGRDSFISNITESAMTASDDCSRKNAESTGDSRTTGNSPGDKVSSDKAPILSFSGQIHDSRHDDSPSKSPPCLVSENSIPKIVIKKNESPKMSPQHPLEISREFADESSVKKPRDYDQEISREFVEENSRKKPGDYDQEISREFAEENNRKKPVGYDQEISREFVEENSHKKPVDYDQEISREFAEENSRKKPVDYDQEISREFVEENSHKKSVDYDQEISREFAEENSRKKPVGYDQEISREFVEENSHKKPVDYDQEISREFVEENSRKKPVDYDQEISREFAEENSRKKPVDYDHEISSHPKIPKMIIRNVRSRPPTPTAVIEADDEPGSFSKDQKLFEVKIKKEEREENREECKVPKMKIKLEDKQLSTMILGSPKSLESGSDVVKSFPKVKIRKVRRSSTSRSPISAEKLPLVGKLSRQSSETEMHVDFPENMDNSNASGSYKFTLIEKTSAKFHNSSGRVERLEEDVKQDRIPKLTIKKNTEVAGSGYSSSSSTKKRRSRSPGDSGSRKRKGTSKHGGSKRDEARSQERRTNSVDNEGNTDSQSLSEKIPKVIIKRASPSAEFKCELSKVGREAITKDSKWQPEVKLQRSWVLDCMAKEPGSGKFALKMLEHSLEDSVDCGQRGSRRNREWKRSVSDCNLDKAVVACRNNRRRSLDEFVACGRRISRDKEQAENYGDEAKPRKLSCSTGRGEEKVETREARKSESETAKSSSGVKAAKSDETSSVEKRDINDTSGNIRAPTREKNAGNYEDNEGSVIKLDSSDESQTTIEILLASPDNSQPESTVDVPESASRVVEGEIGCGVMGKLYADEAIPTQFELELEIVDNSTIDSLDVPIPMPGFASLADDDSTSTVENLHKLERFKPYDVNANDSPVTDSRGSEKFVYSDESLDLTTKNREKSASPREAVEVNAKTISSSDSLVKEVLAAKETLKRCLTRSKSGGKTRPKPRTMTAAEKKQGSGFHFVGLSEIAKTSGNEGSTVFHGDGKFSGSVVDKSATRIRIKDESPTTVIALEKQEKHRQSWSNERRPKEESVTSSTSGKSSKRSATASATNVSRHSGKPADNENHGENSRTKSTASSGGTADRSETIAKHRSSSKSTEKSGDSLHRQLTASTHVKVEDSTRKIKSYKIPKISRSREKNGNEDTAKTDKRTTTPSPTIIMPVLEPQIELDFETAASDRDASRSPPVITKQEEHDIRNELPKKIEDNVHSDKLDSITKQDPEAVTFADIVSQLAYHEKATIRHRRYCTLCERWFPTAARHRRHLTGYQHRHTELTQRRTVHALFMLFTGKPCPRLLPASIVRTDCLPGEPTPLQIAVQDVAISLEDGAQVKPKEASEKND